MRKSIFAKYMTITLCILLACFVIMGAALMFFVSQYWEDEKQRQLSDAADQLSRLVSSAMYINSAATTSEEMVQFNYKTAPIVENSTDTLASTLGAYIFIIRENGAGIHYARPDDGAAFQLGTMPVDLMVKITQGPYYETGNMGGFYDMTFYTAATPILKSGINGSVGAVFVSLPATGMRSYMVDILRMFAIAALFVMLLSVFAVYAFTYQLVKPLRQMAYAARRFGEGDFSYRVKVRGHDETAQLAASFNNMASSLASLEGMRRSFVANVSHELRTPMTSIAGFVDGILDGTIPPKQEKQYLKTVSEEVHRLSRLVRTMLDVSRIEAGELQVKPVRFDMTDLVFRVLFSFETRIEEKNIDIQGLDNSPSVFVEADRDLIHQVVYNLIENAVKFTNKGGYIAITVREVTNRVYVSIKNSGQGIAPEELSHLFDRFYKSDKSRALDKKGAGLGLYIVRMLIGLHKGDIGIRSVEEVYTEFEFWLPHRADPTPE